ncbi:hypothetical protein ACFY0R_37770 [Streptomyces sp. NPDC001633]|uniref:hypothetical protein n=1 Tax=Streptomyces sp. NPDC001633 TaxID=3364595 RepID=UPI0036A1330A
MTLNLQDQATRRMRRLVIALVGVVVILGALVVGLVAGNSSSKPDAKGDDGSHRPPASADPAPTETAGRDDGGYVAPERWVKLPDGAKKKGAFPVQFPHTEEGAMSMLVSSSRNSFSWDAKQVEANIRTYVIGSYKERMASAAGQAAQGVREHTGMPSSGPLPKGAKLTAWPIGVQWKAQDADHVTGSVLVRLTTVPGAGQKAKTELFSLPCAATWEKGDWRVQPTPPNETPKAPEPADMGSAAFNSGGWLAIQEGDRR